MQKLGTKSGQVHRQRQAAVRWRACGSVRLGIYRFPNRETVFWNDGTGRCRKHFTRSTRAADADRFADNMVRELTVKLNGGTVLLQGNEAMAYTAARKILAENLDGIPVDVAVREMDAALKLSGAPSLTECARLYRSIHGQIKSLTVTEAVDEFLMTLQEDTRHHDDLRSRLTKFKAIFGKRNLVEVRAVELENWLQGLCRTSKTFAHYLSSVSQFMNWAQRRSYLPEKQHETSKVTRPKATKARGKDCFTPDELIQLLACATPSEQVCLALQAFLGLRLEEIWSFKEHDAVVNWEDMIWKQNAFHVRREVGKTGERFIHHLQPNLLAWLEPFKNNTGNIWQRKKLSLVYQKIARKSGVKWKNNGLRHGYGSYRMALVKNYHLVSDEMGNSPATLKRDYRIPKTEQEATAWFSITPELVAKYRRAAALPSASASSPTVIPPPAMSQGQVC